MSATRHTCVQERHGGCSPTHAPGEPPKRAAEADLAAAVRLVAVEQAINPFNQQLRVKIVEEERAKTKFAAVRTPQAPQSMRQWLVRKLRSFDRSTGARPWMMNEGEWRGLTTGSQHKLVELTREYDTLHKQLP